MYPSSPACCGVLLQCPVPRVCLRVFTGGSREVCA